MRLFVAIDLPGELKERIFAISQKISQKIPLRLVTEENLHLTLLFLGNRNEEETERLKKLIDGIPKLSSPINLKVENLEFFPDPREPHGVWLNLGGEKEKLLFLYEKIVDGLLKCGFKLEKEGLRFSSHITIGRIKEKIRKAEIPKEFAEFKEGSILKIEKITLFQSQLSSAGPTYFKLAEFKLL